MKFNGYLWNSNQLRRYARRDLGNYSGQEYKHFSDKSREIRGRARWDILLVADLHFRVLEPDKNPNWKRSYRNVCHLHQMPSESEWAVLPQIADFLIKKPRVYLFSRGEYGFLPDGRFERYFNECVEEVLMSKRQLSI